MDVMCVLLFVLLMVTKRSKGIMKTTSSACAVDLGRKQRIWVPCRFQEGGPRTLPCAYQLGLETLMCGCWLLPRVFYLQEAVAYIPEPSSFVQFATLNQFVEKSLVTTATLSIFFVTAVPPGLQSTGDGGCSRIRSWCCL